MIGFEGQRDSPGSNMTSPCQAEQTDPHRVPSALSERPLTALLVPGHRASPQPEHGHIKKAKRCQGEFGYIFSTARKNRHSA